MDCIVWLAMIVAGLTVMVSLIRWFEQATEAVKNGWWNKVMLLIVFPPSCWFFPSRVSAGRPTPVPLHEPVRGFGSLPRAKVAPPPEPTIEPPVGTTPTAPVDEPPPGTPPEFLVKPKVPPKKARPGAVDADKIARLRQKMREQGMLGDEPEE